MYAPFIILFIPYWAGLITAGGLFTLGHLLMLPAMLLAMLRRRAEYTAAQHRSPAFDIHVALSCSVVTTVRPHDPKGT